MAEWQPVLGFEGYYEVSDEGEVRRIFKTKPKRNLNPYHDPVRDAWLVGLCVNSNVTWLAVAHIVWEAFRGELPRYAVVAHLDENKANNALLNLYRGKVGRKRLFTPEQIEYIRQNLDMPSPDIAKRLGAWKGDVTVYKRFIRKGWR